MEISSSIARQSALYSLVLLIVPLILFPEQFGASVVKPSLINIMYELVFYGLVIWVLCRRVTLMQLVQVAGVCFVFRLGLGALFGLAIAVAYAMNVKVALTLGTSGYLPALLLHVIAAPFVLRPLWTQLISETQRRPLRPTRPKTTASTEAGRTSIGVSRARGVSLAAPETPKSAEPEAVPAASFDTYSEIPDAGGNGFERAVRYIGGDASVQMAAVVDHEGLLLGQFSRHNINSEEWAPYALSLLEANRTVLSRGHWGEPQKLRIEMADKRVVVALGNSFSLMVVAEWQSDDLLNIRINQGLEIIKKYVAERYGDKLYEKAERTHVPSA